MNSDPLPSAARKVAGIAEGLCRAVGQSIRLGFVAALVALLVCRRIQRVRARLLLLEARFLAGRLWRRNSGAGVASRVARGSAGMASDGGLPRRFGWLCALVPGEAECFAGQLRVVLAEPGMVALLDACPQAVRSIKPLCWMLGIERSAFVPQMLSTVIAKGVTAEGGSAGGVAAGWVAQTVLAQPPSPQPAVQMPLAAEIMAGMAWVRFIPG